MTLRKKTLVIIIGTFFALFLLLYSVAGLLFFGSVTVLEEEKAGKNMERALTILQNDLYKLSLTALDWSGWDETCSFMSGRNPGYISQNLSENTFTTLRLNLIVFVDNTGEILYAQAYDLANSRLIPLPPDLDRHLFAGSPLLGHQHTDSLTSGFISLDGAPMQVVSRPVITSSHQGPIRGALIMGRLIDEAVSSHLSEMMRLPITFVPYDGTPQANLSQLSTGSNFFVQRNGREAISCYTVLKDIYGNPAILMRLEMPREVLRAVLAIMRNIIVVLAAIGLIFSLVIIVALEKAVLSRIVRLTALAIDIGETGDTSKRLRTGGGGDELSRLTVNINNMLERLEKSRLAIAERELRLRLITDNMLDTISQVDLKGNLLYVSPSHQMLLGYRPEEMVGKPFTDFVYPDDLPTVIATFRRAVHTMEPQRGEFRYLHAGGYPIWAEGIGRIFYDPSGRPAGGVLSCRDISERKEMEERLKYLSLHDTLTGLYNRTYFEQEIERLKKSRAASAGLIICDVDGLKLFNDSMGHSTGDKLLQSAAAVIRSCFREGDIVARIGGDEFAVLLPGTTTEAVEGACRRLREALVAYNAAHPNPPLSISLGFAVCHDLSDLESLFREADNNMYREKLHSRQSARSATVLTLMKALEARDYITEGHADRLQSLVVALAQAVGLPETKTADLRLFARFHDIGKVGISDRILFKKGRLTKAETAEMQRHCEIGHRIAMSAPDLLPIADWILKHHEWWDGNGYPQGLKGEEIPLECRILSIADAYDAMTSDRPYRKAVPHDIALAELIRHAGIQFDPSLVKLFIEVLDIGAISETVA